MEKYIKNLSITNAVLTLMFFLNMFGAANLEGTNTPEVIKSTLVVGANLLFYIVPLSYMVVFGMGMNSLFKRMLSYQNRMVQKKFDKFPLIWFVLSTVGFIAYFVFVNIIFNA